MSYYRNFSPNPPNYNSDASTLTPTATSPTSSINDSSAKYFENISNNNNNNQTDNFKISTTNINNKNINNNNHQVFLTLKFAYSQTGELVVDMEPNNANNNASTTSTTNINAEFNNNNTSNLVSIQNWVKLFYLNRKSNTVKR